MQKEVDRLQAALARCKAEAAANTQELKAARVSNMSPYFMPVFWCNVQQQLNMLATRLNSTEHLKHVKHVAC